MGCGRGGGALVICACVRLKSIMDHATLGAAEGSVLSLPLKRFTKDGRGGRTGGCCSSKHEQGLIRTRGKQCLVVCAFCDRASSCWVVLVLG